MQNQKKALSDSLALVTKKSSKSILKNLEKAKRKKNRYWLIAKNLSYSDYQRYKSFPIFNQNVYRGGLIVEQEIKREHPLGKIAERTSFC